MKIQRIHKGFLLTFLISLWIGCNEPHQVATIFPTKISVKGKQIIDNYGRQVILNGINVVNKSKEENYLFQGGQKFYANLKSWGFNCIRFIIIWDGLEPEPGIYNENYLKEIDQRIKWAGDHGLFVVLDMHQDLYSVKYSDGAPEWATMDEGKPHETGAIWSDAYLLSAAVQTSFDNFWANKPAPDGMGIQDHYANLWKHIAKRYANNSTVIGYDIMNEPFPGTSSLQAMPIMLTAYAELVYAQTGKLMTEKELEETWGNPDNRTEALQILSTKQNYAQVFDALYDLNNQFETTHLQAMYQKVSDKIREVDTQSILFLEHSYFSNSGVKSSIERVLLKDGSGDPNVAYAPHGYDLVTDTKNAADAQSERVSFIFDRIEEKANQLNMPVWLGEWGAYYRSSQDIVPVAQYAVRLIEQKLFGHAYWSYDPDTENLAYFNQALLRPYPAYINGELLNYRFDHDSLQLSVEWNENDASSPTVIFVPWLPRINSNSLNKYEGLKVNKMNYSQAGWVIVNPSASGGRRSLILQFDK